MVYQIEDSKKFKKTLYEFGTIHNYNLHHSEANMMLVQECNLKMLKTIDNMEDKWTDTILKRMATWRVIEMQLSQL